MTAQEVPKCQFVVDGEDCGKPATVVAIRWPNGKTQILALCPDHTAHTHAVVSSAFARVRTDNKRAQKRREEGAG